MTSCAGGLVPDGIPVTAITFLPLVAPCVLVVLINDTNPTKKLPPALKLNEEKAIPPA